MMSLGKAIKKVERYRDDIVTHGGTRVALSVVVENARKWAEHEAAEERLREWVDGCGPEVPRA